jgi:hypothetical protein
MTIERLLKEDRTGSTIQERGEVCQGVIVVCKDSLERRPIALHPSGFPERMLPESISFSCMIESSSPKQREEHVPLVPQSSSVPRENIDRVGEVDLFANGCAK